MTETEAKNYVEELLDMAVESGKRGDPVDAMQFSQAAVNASNALICQLNAKKLERELLRQ